MTQDPKKTATQMQDVDTILAMPQWYVNFNLANLLATGNTDEGTSLQNVSLTMGDNSWLNGKVNSLSTALHVDGSNKKVKFIVAFESGTMDYYDITKAPPTKLQADISGLQFGFLVDLSFQDLANNADIPADIKAQIEARMSNLGAGAFTIQQFFMDLTEAAVSTPDPTVTSYPEGFPASAKASFPNYLRTYIEDIRQAGGHVLGYGVRVQNPGGIEDPVASFPPTGLEFVTNQYQNPNGEKHEDLDTVLYLMMSGEDPTFSNNPVPWWGNYVVPGDDQNGWDGCMAMNTRLFVTEFLLQRLAPIVCSYWHLYDTDDSLAIQFTPATGQFTPKALGGTWSSGSIKSKSHKTNTFSNDDAEYNSSFEVSLDVKPGTNEIVIQRMMKFDQKVTHWYGIDGAAAKSSIHVWYEIPSTITVKLEGVDDGALQVEVDVKTKQPEDGTIYGDDYGWLITKVEGSESVWKDVGDLQEQTINNAVNIAVPEGLGHNVKQEIEQSLNLTPFVFPGGAELFMNNPMFNAHGDLLVGVQYKG